MEGTKSGSGVFLSKKSISMSRTSWNPSTNPASKLVPGLVREVPPASPSTPTAAAKSRGTPRSSLAGDDTASLRINPGSPAPNSPLCLATTKSKRVSSFGRHSAPATGSGDAGAEPPLSVTEKTLQLLSMQTDDGSSDPHTRPSSTSGSSTAAQPKTPTISEASCRIASKRSRLSEASGSTDVDPAPAAAPLPQLSHRPTVTIITGGACNAPRPSPSSCRGTAGRRVTSPHQQGSPTHAPAASAAAAAAAAAAEELQLQRLIAALEAPSQLDFTSLRCRFAVAAAPAPVPAH